MLIEMSYPLSPDIPVFPGLPLDEFEPHSRMDRGEESNTTMTHLFTHNGTHVDAPFHFYIGGKTIDQVPIEDFHYKKPLMTNIPTERSGKVQREDIEGLGQKLFEADLLLLCTDFYKIRSDKTAYADDFPSLSIEAARFLRDEVLNIKAVAIDTLSIESCVDGPKTDFQVHKMLLASDIHSTRPLLIYEDVDMSAVQGKEIKQVFAFPLRLVGIDGSPVTMVAEV